MSENANAPALTTEQLNYLALVAAGKSIRVAAKMVGRSVRQVYRWKNEDPAFQAAWDESIATVWVTIKDRLKCLGTLALDVLEKVMRDKGASHRDRMDASKSILTFIGKAIQDDELRKRIEKLIEKMEGGGG
jgi:ACT domain-containing protein